ncbi:MAG: SDR family NAD(P)-dependent oxidoreductase [Undibacterium sp.]
MEQYLKGKHVLILGASSDIGAATAYEYVRYGATALTLTYGSKRAEVEELAKKLRRKGVKVHVAHHDRSGFKPMREMLEEAVAAIGLEIYAAADFIATSPDLAFQKQTPELWNQVMNVNLVGAFVSGREICNRMKKTKTAGYLVIVTSINGRITFGPYSAPYNASKAGQESLVKDLAIEYSRHGINVNGVAPAWVNTKMNVTVPKKDMAREMQKGLVTRQAEPEEVARQIVALSSDEHGSYHHGEIIDIKGGYGIR